jgi:hypothetical protein
MVLFERLEGVLENARVATHPHGFEQFLQIGGALADDTHQVRAGIEIKARMRMPHLIEALRSRGHRAPYQELMTAKFSRNF